MKKITKILTLGILFLFAMTLSLSAQKCKYNYNKKDPFTGVETKGIEVDLDGSLFITPIGTIFKSKMGFNKIGETYFVNIELVYSGNIRESIKKNDTFAIKLSNGEIVTIYSQDESLPALVASVGNIFTSYVAKYDIDAASIKKIAESVPTFIRINLDSRIYDKELDSKTKKNFTNAAKCILQ